MLLHNLGLNNTEIDFFLKKQDGYNKSIAALLLWVEEQSNNKIAENVLHHSFEVLEIMMRSGISGEDFSDILGKKGYEVVGTMETDAFNSIIMKNSTYVEGILSGDIILTYPLDFETMLVIKPQDNQMMKNKVVLN